MPDVFWIGLVVVAFCVLLGLVAGAKSRTANARSGLAMGFYLGVMFAFPLLALGLATS
jgi:hypothetical protein